MNAEQMKESEDSFLVDLEESTSEAISQPAEQQEEQLFDSAPVEEKDEGAGSGELENYSENVQKRINQLTAKRKQAAEEAEAAYQYAQQLQQQNEQMKQRLAQLDEGYINEYGSRVESQYEQAIKLLKEAREIGDVDKEMEAQQLLSRLNIEKERVRVSKLQQQSQEAPVQQQPVQQQVQQVQPQQQLDPKLVSWMGRNDGWFNKDAVMTAAAEAIHKQLVGVEDFDPTTDEYYAEIDKRMRQEFPHKFQDKRQNAQAVTPASSGRNVKSGRKKTVELTPGQVAFAKKMGIPLERYAKEVAKLDKGA